MDVVSLLPLDSSASARRLRAGLVVRGQPGVGLIVSDTFGRPWRDGLTNVAIGVSGMAPLRSYVGQIDEHGYDLRVTVMAIADELAAAAEPVMNKLDRVARRRRARAGRAAIGGRRVDARAPGGDGSVPLGPVPAARRAADLTP